MKGLCEDKNWVIIDMNFSVSFALLVEKREINLNFTTLLLDIFSMFLHGGLIVVGCLTDSLTSNLGVYIWQQVSVYKLY